jgi:hypothetical protein
MVAWIQPSAAWSPAASATVSTAWPAVRKSAQYPDRPGTRIDGEELPGMSDEARRGGMGGGMEQDLVLGLNPVQQFSLIS